MNAINTKTLQAALTTRYAGDAWSLLWEVPDGTGRDKVRSADAIAMSLWPSRGLLLHGHELKVSRADWLKELKSPAKAESICRFCDHWWVVAAPDIIRGDELPPTWGLMTYKGGKLITTKQAPVLSASAVDRAFLAGLLRASTRNIADDHVIRESRRAGYDEGFKAASKSDERLLAEIAELKESIERFERVSGVRINKWDKSDAQALRVKEVLATDAILNRSRQDLQNVRRSVNGITDALHRYDQRFDAAAS